MEISFLGALGCVTGSCTWLRDEKRNWSFLVDCGMAIGEDSSSLRPDSNWPFQPKDIRFVLLTHAHLDHCGLLPLLYKRGFNGKVWCTPETAALAREILIDAARVSKGKLYKESDVDRIKWESFNKGKYFGYYQPLDTDLFAQTLRSGHILGAVSIIIFWGEPQSKNQKGILFSGDIGPGGKDEEITPLIKFSMKPVGFDYAVLESTYGSTVRQEHEKSPEARIQKLEKLVRKIHASNGTLMLPSFALGRTQEVIFDLHHVLARNPDISQDIKVVLDAKMARKINEITMKLIGQTEIVKRETVRLKWLGRQVFRTLGLNQEDPEDIEEAIRLTVACLTPVDDDTENVFISSTRGNEIARNWRPALRLHQGERALQDKPTILICGAADGSYGTAVAWTPQVLEGENHILATTGFCSPSSPFGQLLEWAALPDDQKRLHVSGITSERWEKPILPKNIHAEITKIEGYSGHADQQDLIKFIFYDQAISGKHLKKIFIQHGNDQSRRALATALMKSRAETGDSPEICLPARRAELQWHQLD